MEIDGLNYKEFAMIREALEEKRENIWKERYHYIIKKNKLSFEEVQKAKEKFNQITNPNTREGICNTLLKKLEEIEEQAQIALGMKAKK